MTDTKTIADHLARDLAETLDSVAACPPEARVRLARAIAERLAERLAAGGREDVLGGLQLVTDAIRAARGSPVPRPARTMGAAPAPKG